MRGRRKWDEVQDTNGRAPVTIGTIIHRAKKDDYEGYLAWKMAWKMARVRVLAQRCDAWKMPGENAE